MLKAILQKRMDVSRKLLSRLKLTEQGIMLNGERVYISVPVKAGDMVEIRMETEVSEDILPQPIPFEILYEDEHLLVVNKPAGLIVHPTHGHYVDTLANGVVHYWASKGESYRFRPVHRLDQETSGVLAVAKNPYAHQHISAQMIAGTVEKRYTALVHGQPPLEHGRIDGPIDRDPAEPHRRIVTPSGYPSLTLYEVKRAYSQGSRVELKLESGRTHQIRVHMTSIGCPLIGDRMYRHGLYRRLQAAGPGETGVGTGMVTEMEPEPKTVQSAGFAEALASIQALDNAMPRQALHASRLAFTHPVSRVEVCFEAPLPEDMRKLEALLAGQAGQTGQTGQMGQTE